MKDLSVLDVQRMLRQHANLGHDVISDPHTAQFGEATDPFVEHKPFGVAILHQLRIPQENEHHAGDGLPNTSFIHSYLAHGDKPMASLVSSHVAHTGNGDSALLSRYASSAHPEVTITPNGDISSFNLMRAPGNWQGYAYDHKNQPKRTLHDVLQTHLKISPVYKISHKGSANHISSDTNSIGWNIKQALSTMSHPLKPFSGLIHISRSTPTGFENHVYNPKTEQLLRFEH